MNDNHIEGMKRIRKWEDVLEFAGAVVAFVSDSSYISSRCVEIETDNPTRYGVISASESRWTHSNGLGFNMDRLIDAKAVPSNCALSNRYLEDATYMRRITPSEGEKIKSLIESGQAMFCYKRGWVLD